MRKVSIFIMAALLVTFIVSCYENTGFDLGTKPGGVTMGTPSDVKSDRVTMHWSKSVGGGFLCYQLYRGMKAGITEANDIVAIVFDRDSTAIINTGLYPETTYYYRMMVTDGDFSVWSNEISIKTAKESGGSYTSIYDIQYTEDQSGDSPYLDSVVTTTGIVTANFTVGTAQYAFIGENPGGPWRGLCLYAKTAGDLPCEIGDSVVVTGTITEYYNMTEMTYIEPAQFIVVEGGHNINPYTITTGKLAAGSSEAEQFEDVLVTTGKVKVTAEKDNYGEFKINDNSGEVPVDDYFKYTYVPVLDQELNFVRGVVNYSYSVFKIEPRSDDDIGQ